MKPRVPTCFSKTIRGGQNLSAEGAAGLDFSKKGTALSYPLSLSELFDVLMNSEVDA
jgi:hypothetical protein